MPLSLLSPQSYLSSSSGKGEPDDLHLPLHRRTLAIMAVGTRAAVPIWGERDRSGWAWLGCRRGGGQYDGMR